MEFSTKALMLLSYGFLFLTVISLWFPNRTTLKTWQIMLVLSVVFGLFSQQIKTTALIPIALLPIAIYCQQLKKLSIYIRSFFFVFIILICLGLSAHLFPGFYNLKVLDKISLSQNAVHYTLHLNYDKTLVGIFILGIGHQLISSWQDWKTCLRQMILPMILTISVVIALALAWGFVQFDPKLPNSWLIWLVNNLLFVSFAEEAFFRGFLQKNFTQAMKNVFLGNYLAILSIALLFGLTHYTGGTKSVCLAVVAGVGYGFIYDKTKRIEASIIMHFGVNLIHFLLFTYPMLASK